MQCKCIDVHLTGGFCIQPARFNYYNVELYPSRQPEVSRMVKGFIYIQDILSKLVAIVNHGVYLLGKAAGEGGHAETVLHRGKRPFQAAPSRPRQQISSYETHTCNGEEKNRSSSGLSPFYQWPLCLVCAIN